MTTTMIRGIPMLLAVLALGACGGRPGVRIYPGGVTAEADTIWTIVRVENSSAVVDDGLFVVSCPRAPGGGVQADRCRWQSAGTGAEVPIGTVLEAHQGLRANEARAMVAAGSGCPIERVALQASEPHGDAEGYWFDACGERRFILWNAEESRFMDRTP